MRRTDEIRLCRSLGDLLGMGFALEEAVSRVRRQASGSLAVQLERAEQRARQGASLSEALKGSLPSDITRAVEAAERAGALVEGLTRVAEILEEAEARRSSLRVALLYPQTLLTGAMIFVWLVDSQGALGTIYQLFEGMSLAYPWATRILLDLHRALGQLLLWSLLGRAHPVCLVLLLGIVGLGLWLLRHLPAVGEYTRRQQAITWLRWLDYFVERGVPLTQAARSALACGELSSDLRDALDRATEAVEGGDSLGAALEGESRFPRLAAWLVGQTEALRLPSGSLARVADSLARELELLSSQTLAMLPPLTALATVSGLGLGSIFLIVSCGLPLVQLVESL